MGRWAPGAQGRLEQAALDLYVEQGFENTTVSEIAERAGLTERTFFRYFADKREVLFSGAEALKEFLVSTTLGAPDTAPPMEAVALALEAAGAALQERGMAAKRRHGVIMANPELQERELIKMASWAADLADALRKRGVEDPTATLAAETSMAVFRVAFTDWVQEPKKRDLPQTIRASLDQLRTITTDR
jgi:AcrR family transcriptional regulator